MNRFWEEKHLDELSSAEWESLCDGCGKCCLVKLEDEDSGEVCYTDVSCHLLDLDTCRCKDYTHRKEKVSECITLSSKTLKDYQWLPSTCAYRLLAEGKPLAEWHPLIAGMQNSALVHGFSVQGRVVSESWVHPEDIEERIIHWVL